MGFPDHLPDVRIRLETQRFGQHFLYYESTPSTNTIARDIALQVPEGTLLVTDEQTAGRGRLGRRWHAPAGSAILMSLIVHPPSALNPVHLTALCALAWLDTIAAAAGLTAALKWPNDILIDGKKTAGILTETVYNGSHLAAMIVGIGLNVHQDRAALAEATAGSGGLTATSIDGEAGRWISRVELLSLFLHNADRRYTALLERLQHDEHRAVRDLCREWAERMNTIGQHVSVRVTENGSDSIVEGTAEKIDADGALLIRHASGRVHRLLAGDVSLR